VIVAILLSLGAAGTGGAAASPLRDPEVATYYISPNGSDSNPGTAALPWKTFAYAIPRLYPGDTLSLLDGIYERNTTGLPVVNCTGGARNGTSGSPITMRAENERRAYIRSDGSAAALEVKRCSFWNITGLRGSSADLPSGSGGSAASVFEIKYSSDIVARRLLSSNSNRYFNDHTLEIAYSQRVVLEESEAYSFHRHGFSLYQNKNLTLRRNYANSRNYADIPNGYSSNDPLGGDEAFVLYYTSDSIIENSVAQRATQGFQVHGGPNYDWTQGGQNNRLLGNITIGDPVSGYGGKVSSRMRPNQNGQEVVWPVKNNTYKNTLIVGVPSQAMYVASAVNSVFENVTFYNVSGDGAQVKEADSSTPWCGTYIPESCGFTLLNSLIFRAGDYGVTVRNTVNNNWLVDYSNVAGSAHNYNPDNEPINDGSGNIRHSMSIVPTGIEMSQGRTPIYIPADSNMKGIGSNGADIGANILYRYQDGALTQVPLWSPSTGAFTCGVVIAGVNDQANDSCSTFHPVLNVNPGTLPPGYGGGGTPAPTYTSTRTPVPAVTPPTSTRTPTPVVAPPTATRTSTRTPTRTATRTSTHTPAPGVTPPPPATNTPVPAVTPPPATNTPAPGVTPPPEPTSCTVSFTDVPPGSAFYPYVQCLACRGIVSGYSNGKFRPEVNVTRGQAAKIVSNSAGFDDPPVGQTYEDVPPGHTFYLFIERLSSRGLVSGYPCGGPGERCGPENRPYFRPVADASRGQISKLISNAAGYNEPPGGQTFEDVSPEYTFYPHIERLAARGVVNGYPCGSQGEPCNPGNRPYFRPANSVTRGQITRMAAPTFFPECFP
jgi:hypothetical protein